MVLTVPGDIAQPGVGQRIVDAALQRFGRIDTVVNNAGHLHRQTVHRLHRRRLRRHHRREPARLLRGLPRGGAAPCWPTTGGGHVVNVSTSLVDHANSQVPSALASLTKGGLNAVTKVAGDRVRGSRNPGQRRRSRHHPHPDARPGDPRCAGGDASGRPDRRDRRRRRRGPVPGATRRSSPARSCTSTVVRVRGTERRESARAFSTGGRPASTHDGPQRVAEVFTEDAIFQGLRPYSVGRQGVVDYYAAQPPV